MPYSSPLWLKKKYRLQAMAHGAAAVFVPHFKQYGLN